MGTISSYHSIKSMKSIREGPEGLIRITENVCSCGHVADNEGILQHLKEENGKRT